MSEFGQAVRHFWTLDWSATHLNHGSYGATPKPVLAAQDAVRQDMERTLAPLVKPEGAVVVDTTDRGVAEVVDGLLRVIEQARCCTRS